MADSAIRFEKVCFSYGEKTIADSLAFEIEKGEKVCLFGPSGIGKSTVLRLIFGLELPSDGTVIVDGKISPVFQEDRLLPFKTVKENAEMFSGGMSADEILKALDIFENRDEYPAELSGGMARRTALARALAAPFDILVLDEPFNGLDDENTEKAVRLILEKCRGKTLLCVLHSRELAEKLGCRIIEL